MGIRDRRYLSEYGYRVKEIVKDIGRDPVVITRYLKTKDDFTKEVEYTLFAKRENGKCQ